MADIYALVLCFDQVINPRDIQYNLSNRNTLFKLYKTLKRCFNAPKSFNSTTEKRLLTETNMFLQCPENTDLFDVTGTPRLQNVADASALLNVFYAFNKILTSTHLDSGSKFGLSVRVCQPGFFEILFFPFLFKGYRVSVTGTVDVRVFVSCGDRSFWSGLYGLCTLTIV